MTARLIAHLWALKGSPPSVMKLPICAYIFSPQTSLTTSLSCISSSLIKIPCTRHIQRVNCAIISPSRCERWPRPISWYCQGDARKTQEHVQNTSCKNRTSPRIGTTPSRALYTAAVHMSNDTTVDHKWQGGSMLDHDVGHSDGGNGPLFLRN